jgi:hypothetical protein
MIASVPIDTAYSREVRLQCYAVLENFGFARYRKENVDFPLWDGFNCWVGLNSAIEKFYVEINPFVGVHVVPIEKLWTSLKTGRYPARYDRGNATYAIHLGQIVPDEPAFHFTRTINVKDEARRLGNLYLTNGIDYAKSIASYDALLPLLQSRADMLGGYPERVACCLYLMDRAKEARSFAENFLRTQPEYFEGFGEPFLKMLDAPSTDPKSA